MFQISFNFEALPFTVVSLRIGVLSQDCAWDRVKRSGSDVYPLKAAVKLLPGPVADRAYLPCHAHPMYWPRALRLVPARRRKVSVACVDKNVCETWVCESCCTGALTTPTGPSASKIGIYCDCRSLHRSAAVRTSERTRVFMLPSLFRCVAEIPIVK